MGDMLSQEEVDSLLSATYGEDYDDLNEPIHVNFRRNPFSNYDPFFVSFKELRAMHERRMAASERDPRMKDITYRGEVVG